MAKSKSKKAGTAKKSAEVKKPAAEKVAKPKAEKVAKPKKEKKLSPLEILEGVKEIARADFEKFTDKKAETVQSVKEQLAVLQKAIAERAGKEAIHKIVAYGAELVDELVCDVRQKMMDADEDLDFPKSSEIIAKLKDDFSFLVAPDQDVPAWGQSGRFVVKLGQVHYLAVVNSPFLSGELVNIDIEPMILTRPFYSSTGALLIDNDVMAGSFRHNEFPWVPDDVVTVFDVAHSYIYGPMLSKKLSTAAGWRLENMREERANDPAWQPDGWLGKLVEHDSKQGYIDIQPGNVHQLAFV